MEPAVIQALSSFALELLKTYGLSAIPAIGSGVIWWRAESRCKAKDATIKERDATIDALKARIDAAQQKRIEDALQMIEVAKSGTETMANRSEGDAIFREALQRLVTRVEDLADRLPPPSRSPRRR